MPSLMLVSRNGCPPPGSEAIACMYPLTVEVALVVLAAPPASPHALNARTAAAIASRILAKVVLGHDHHEADAGEDDKGHAHTQEVTPGLVLDRPTHPVEDRAENQHDAEVREEET